MKDQTAALALRSSAAQEHTVNMDLATVKATVKAWERSFKASHKRDPTKDDIKKDPSGISEKYALYRKLSKQSQNIPSSSSTSTSLASRGESSRSTPRVIPNNEYPATPTPPTRKSSGHRIRASSPSAELPSRKQQDESNESASRTGSSASNDVPGLSSPSRLITPKKVRAYSGPIHDPNPVNPFAVTPTKTPSSGQNRRSFHNHANNARSQNAATGESSSSPFIHASSPRKLKEVLEANSLRKVKERGKERGVEMEITPRTRARKRLRGEVVADTPVKERPARRRRGQARAVSATSEVTPAEEDGIRGPGAHGKGKVPFEDLEDEFGPSPLKPGLDGGFITLFDDADHGAKSSGRAGERENAETVVGRGRPSAMLGLFGRSLSGSKVPKAARPATTESTHGDMSTDVPVIAPSSPSPASPLDAGVANPEAGNSTAQPGTHLQIEEDAPSQSGSVSHRRAQKVLALSDGEEDEWDPEGGHIQHQVFITGTRRAPIKPRNSSSDDPHSDDDDDRDQPENTSSPSVRHDAEAAEDQDMAGGPPTPDLEQGGGTTTEGTSLQETLTSVHPSSPVSSMAPPLMSMLSLQSPRKGKSRQMEELRYKAIFDPVEANRLKALKRGQDVFVSGEVRGAKEGEDEWAELETLEDVVDGDGGEEGEEDDDWEEEPEGWKETRLGVDDEDW